MAEKDTEGGGGGFEPCTSKGKNKKTPEVVDGDFYPIFEKVLALDEFNLIVVFYLH